MEGIELGRILAGRNHAPVVYFLRVGDRVKIGWTTDITHRVASFSLPMLDVAMVVPGGRDTEHAFHQRWAIYQVPGCREWFYVRGSLRRFMQGTCTRRSTSAPIATATPAPDGLLSLSDAVALGTVGASLASLRNARARDREFPRPAERRGTTDFYRPDELVRWEHNRPRASTEAASVADADRSDP